MVGVYSPIANMCSDISLGTLNQAKCLSFMDEYCKDDAGRSAVCTILTMALIACTISRKNPWSVKDIYLLSKIEHLLEEKEDEVSAAVRQLCDRVLQDAIINPHKVKGMGT